MWLSWCLCPRVPCEAAVKVPNGQHLFSPEDWIEGACTSRLTHRVFNRIWFTWAVKDWGLQFLAGSWPGAPTSSVPCGPMGQLATRQLAFDRGEDRLNTDMDTQRGRALQWHITSSCCFLARIKSLWPVFTQGRHHTGLKFETVGSLGLSQETAYHLIKGKLLPHNSSPQWNTTCYLFLSSFKKEICFKRLIFL